ncbi:MAG: cell division protein FtsZ, partial [Muribaculaceae bacterium]|nr:cell division protein FtsZ [Muribaculaceae bacterium]
ALAGADEMSKYVDALLVINNERLTEIYPDLNFINAFGKADDTLSTAARSISELITCNAHINIDFNDVDTTLRDSGAAIISTGYGDGEHRVTEAINDALNSPLLKNRDITSSKRLLFNLSFSREAEREFKMEEANELTEFISSIDSDVDVIWGMAFDETLGDKVKITILAAGFDITIDTKPDTVGKRGKDSIPFVGKAKDEQSATPSTRMTEEYGERALKAAKARARYIIIQPSQMDDDKFIDAFEKSPTYNREKKKAEEIKEVSKSSSLPIPDEAETVVDTASSGPTILF